MNTTRLTDTRLLVLSIVLSGGIFAVDLSLPLGVASGVPYVVIVLASLWSPKRRDTYLAASTGTALTALGYFFSAAGGIFWMVLVNRFLALFVIWAAALLVLQRKSAEAALRKSEKRYRNLFHQAPISLWEEDFSALQQWIAELRKTGVSDLGEYLQHHPEAVQEAARLVRVIDVNEGTLRLFGVGSMAELFSAPLKDVGEHKGSAFSNQAFAEQLIAIWEGRRRFETEFAASTSGGAHIDCLLQWVAPRTPGNLDLSYVIIALSDITDRKRAEAALRESELWMHNIFNSLEESVFVITADRHLVNVNAAAERTFGYSKDELADNSTEILHIDHDHYVEFGKRIQRAFDRSETACFEFELKRKNGEVFPSEHTVSLLKNDAGKTIGIVSVVRDITERKRAEEELRLKQFAIDHSADPIYWIGLNGRILYVNQAACRSLGYTQEELQSMTVPDIDPGFSDGLLEEHWNKMKEARSMTFESHHRTKQGRVFPVEVTTNYVQFEEREFHWVYVRDITERKQAERAVRVSEARLNGFLEAAPVGMVVFDDQLRYLKINKSLAKINGLSVDDHLGKTMQEVVPHIAPGIEALYREILTTGEPVLNTEVSGEVSSQPGVARHFLSSQFRIPADEPETFMLGAIVLEITEIKQTEEALRESERRLRSVLDGLFEAPIGLCFLDRDLRYVFINEWLAKLNGTSVEGHLGRT
ncbi:MAG: PAS domain S-box protein, partial [Planctomycetes bacterium]|nr:PAS domain S-box protein [Planctomycetota bacterium]